MNNLRILRVDCEGELIRATVLRFTPAPGRADCPERRRAYHPTEASRLRLQRLLQVHQDRVCVFLVGDPGAVLYATGPLPEPRPWPAGC